MIFLYKIFSLFLYSVRGQVYEVAVTKQGWFITFGLPGFEPGFKFTIGSSKGFNNGQWGLLLFLLSGTLFLILMPLFYSFKLHKKWWDKGPVPLSLRDLSPPLVPQA